MRQAFARCLYPALFAPLLAAAGDFTFSVVGETFTYTDAERTFTGRIVVPAGAGPFPAIVFDHGQGGAPNSYPNVDVMRSWGAVVVAPTLTHVLGGETLPLTTGQCPENLARGIALVNAISEQSYVDPSRIAFFGHSKGAYAAIAHVSALGTRVRVAAMSAGGVLPDAAGTDQAAPTHAEALGVVAPFIMFHGSSDDSVPPPRSADFKAQLDLRAIPNLRVVYDVEALPGNLQHNLHQVPEINDDMLARTLAWYTEWGLFGATTPLFADGFE
jgi:dienelactone hydrolase